MGIKRKLGMGIGSAVLGLALVGGGTFAYFSDTAEQTNSFASGTLGLSVDPEVNVQLENIKPGDWTNESFELENDGTLPIKYVDLQTEYTVTRDGESVVGTLEDAYAESLTVQFLKNSGGDKDHTIIYETSLKDLRDMNPEDLATEIDVEWELVWPFPPVYLPYEVEHTGLAAGDTADFDVKFVFEETGEDQNVLQNLDLDLTWTFEGFQEDGEEL